MVITLNQWKKVLDKGRSDSVQRSYTGVVRSIEADGSYMVDLNGSGVLTRCDPYCDASVGDAVRVLVENRRPMAIARRR